MDSGERKTGLPIWLEEPPGELRLHEVREALSKIEGRDPRERITPVEAYELGLSYVRSASRADADRGRAWLWVAAAMKMPQACHELVCQITEHGRSTPGAPEAEALFALVGLWVTGAPAPRMRSLRRPPAMTPVPDELSTKPGDFAFEPEEDPLPSDTVAAPPFNGLVVAPRVGDRTSKEGAELARRYQHFIGVPMPFKGVMPDPRQLEIDFLSAFPWATGLARWLRGQFSLLRASGIERPVLPPLLLVGPSGCGKTTMLEWLTAYCEFPSMTVPIGGTADSAGLSAVSRGWQTAQFSAPLQAMADHLCANPAIILDELDKGVSQAASRNGSVAGTLLAMLQPPADGFRDAYLMAPVDIRHITFMASANALGELPDTVLSRFKVQTVPAPGAEHFPVLLEGVMAKEAARLGVQEQMLPFMSVGDRAWMQSYFEKSGCNIRRLEQAYQLIAGDRAADEEMAMRRPH